MTMKCYDITGSYRSDPTAHATPHPLPEASALETHLYTLLERLEELRRHAAPTHLLADAKLQVARAMASLERGAEAWPLAREAFDIFILTQDFESAADACDILFQAEQPGSLAALGQGIWLAVTYPIDPELAVELLSHVVDETPPEADGAAVAATTALFLADLRATGKTRENLMFFAAQTLSEVARRHSQIASQEAFDLWMDRLELREPEKFLVRLRNIVDVLVQDDWWFDRDTLLAQLPLGDGAGGPHPCCDQDH
jgi:hypothetical protein